MYPCWPNPLTEIRPISAHGSNRDNIATNELENIIFCPIVDVFQLNFILSSHSILVVRTTGFEPVTPRLGIWCSILLSYAPVPK